MNPRRTVFFVSDGTGITAEMLGHSLLTQFEGVQFDQITLPFVDSLARAEECRERIAAEAVRVGAAPIVFSTLVDRAYREVVWRAPALCFDFFETFIAPLEEGLGIRSTHHVGRSHSALDMQEYQRRIEAVNYSMAHDDGASNVDLDQAEVILVGVSRSGKTPTCLYLALQFGVSAANYPLTPEDFDRDLFPRALRRYRTKLFGLSIAPDRLSEIRQARRPNSRYASLENCRYEVDAAERMMRDESIRWLDSTKRSIEEIATTILREMRIDRHVY
ncbi:MAG: kinase/pyrophosphorylase [Betaproteobacteria bacterium]|jgi:regulator of PEP synthase PpsR (kinase-PPPase family)|nr:kinase/pyrophosphorylase [Betaproteobacteria bacterium]